MNENAIPQIRNVYKVCLELSTLCNYSHLHKKCPLHEKKEHAILPSDVVIKIIDELSEISFKGMFLFNLYNEPMIDPRLFLFTRLAKEKCPNSTVFIITNGYYLDQHLADELPSHGVDMLALSLYTKREKQRLQQLKYPIKVRFWDYTQTGLDDRLDLYSKPKGIPTELACGRGAPLEEINITAQGDVGLCCLDWQHSIAFGNVRHEKLADIIAKPQFVQFYEDLRQGKRTLPICQACTSCPTSRGYVKA